MLASNDENNPFSKETIQNYLLELPKMQFYGSRLKEYQETMSNLDACSLDSIGKLKEIMLELQQLVSDLKACRIEHFINSVTRKCDSFAEEVLKMSVNADSAKAFVEAMVAVGIVACKSFLDLVENRDVPKADLLTALSKFQQRCSSKVLSKECTSNHVRTFQSAWESFCVAYMLEEVAEMDPLQSTR
eukprot:2375250-Amphidinium_carterae.1